MASDNFEEQEEREQQRPEPPKRPGPILHQPKVANPILKMIVPVGVVIVLIVAGYFYYRYKVIKSSTANSSVVSLNQGADSAQTQMGGEGDTTASVTTTPAVEQKTVSQPPQTIQQPPVEKPAPAPKKNVVVKKEPAAKKEKLAKHEPVVKHREETAKKKIAKHEAKPSRHKDMAAAEKPATKMASSSGNYTIFVGSFKSKKSADALAERWKDAGYPTHITTRGAWHRVSIGNYATKEEGKQVAEKMRDAFENGYWVDTLN